MLRSSKLVILMISCLQLVYSGVTLRALAGFTTNELSQAEASSSILISSSFKSYNQLCHRSIVSSHPGWSYAFSQLAASRSRHSRDPFGARRFCAEASAIEVGFPPYSTGIRSIPDLQSVWFILLFCASTRANFLLRALPHSATREFAIQHDTTLCECLSALLGVEVDTWEVASLPVSFAGLGLLSAQRVRHADNWTSWSDSLGMILRRHPDIAATIVRALRVHNPGAHVEGAVAAGQALVDAGFVAPSWEELTGGGREGGFRPNATFDDDDPSTQKHGWQHVATQPVNARQGTVRPRLTDTARVQLRSQSGPMASAPFTCCPVARYTTFDPQALHLLLLRRLWLPVPSSSRVCRWGDPSGHHRAACAVAEPRVPRSGRIQDVDIVPQTCSTNAEWRSWLTGCLCSRPAVGDRHNTGVCVEAWWTAATCLGQTSLGQHR